MRIETIFNEGDAVWTMSNNKAVETTCIKINIEQSKEESDLAWILDFDEKLPWDISLWEKRPAVRKESELFKNKNELIESIFSK